MRESVHQQEKQMIKNESRKALVQDQMQMAVQGNKLSVQPESFKQL